MAIRVRQLEGPRSADQPRLIPQIDDPQGDQAPTEGLNHIIRQVRTDEKRWTYIKSEFAISSRVRLESAGCSNIPFA
jgi:hypothetical protein